MRLPDFSFPSDTVPAIMKKASAYNQYINKEKAENFIKIGTVGGSSPIYLPAILDGIDVSDSLLTDSVQLNDKSGQVKIISGWNDCDISIKLILIDIPKYTADNVTPDITRYDCLKEIVSFFRQIKDGHPCVYTIQHPHLEAWGLQEVLFDTFKTSESRGKRIVNCTLEFDEYDSTIGKSQDRQLGMQTTTQTEAASTSETPTVDAKTQAGIGELNNAAAAY
jgi:hypothetical protein